MSSATLSVRGLLWFVGVVLLGVGVAVTIWSSWGVGPVDVLTTGVSSQLGVGVHVGVFLVHLLMVCAAVVLGARFNLLTVVASLIIAAVVWATLPVLHLVFPGLSSAWFPVLCSVGVVLTGVGAGLQIATNVAASPFELLTVVLSQHLRGLTKTRMFLEAVLVAAGWFLGGQMGWGSLLSVCLTGVVIAFTVRVSSPLVPCAEV